MPFDDPPGRAVASASSVRKLQLRRNQGRCTCCGKPNPDSAEWSTCASCREAARDRYYQRKGADTRAQKGSPRRCEECGRAGHTARTCDGIQTTATPGECLRCFEPAAPGQGLCVEHVRTMAALAEEKRRGMWEPLGELEP